MYKDTKNQAFMQIFIKKNLVYLKQINWSCATGTKNIVHLADSAKPKDESNKQT